ncbi:MAG TPA: nucleotide exchange factor GrpE [Ktedonobacteraceae bacterium]|nr:nucleotide exchange factor GrpE [Ktedonobacteraceae bacterium]
MPEESQEITGRQAEQPGQSGQPTQQAGQENGTVNAGNAGSSTSDKDALIAQLEAQLSQARQEAADNWNRFLRERAEMDNFRKRQERLMADRVLQQKKALLQKLLGVLDNVERALVYQETLDKQGLQQALRMMQWQLSEVLRGEGLSPVPTVGETFNPYLHEAIEAVEDSDQPEGTIVEEVQKGYLIGDDTLRPARVKVSSGNNKIVESQPQE